MTSASCPFDGPTFLRLLLLRGQPGSGEELPCGFGGPLPAGEFVEKPPEVGAFVGAVEASGGEDAGKFSPGNGLLNARPPDMPL